MKIKWKVANAPTGRYRSFEKRSWPSADYENGQAAAMIRCEDEYVPRNVKEGSHAELTVWIADHSEKPVWKWKTLKKRFATLAEAKEGVKQFLAAHPEFMPKNETS